VKKELFLVFISALLFVVPVLWVTRNLELRLDTDYDAHLPVYEYIIDEIRVAHKIPSKNPYIATGLPVAGDPLSQIFNPLFMAPLIFLGVEQGMRIVFVVIVLLSGLAMWKLLAGFGISGLPRIWGAVLYEVSGAISARISAGHVEKFFSFALIPLFFWSVLRSGISMKKIIIASCAIAGLFYSGDFYSIWMVTILFVCARVFWLVRKKTSIGSEIISVIRIVSLSLFLVMPKLIPFLQARNSFERFFPIHPMEGSIHFFLTPLTYIIPVGSFFYDRPFFQRTLGFHYNWYEYFNFISPVAFMLLFSILRVKKVLVSLLLLLLCIGSLYVSMKFTYSPFYWLVRFIPTLGVFRVPQRMLAVTIPLVILLLTLCAASWQKTIKTQWLLLLIFVSSIIWSTIVSQRILLGSFEHERIEEQFVARELRRRDSSNFYVANFVCCIQKFFMRERIANINYYYAWRPRSAPDFINQNASGFNYSPLASVRPTYIIAPKSEDFSVYVYKPFFETTKARVWKTDEPTIVPAAY